ncbi:unnamed protein product [Dibothriocephalus latus]|uniref:Reverse transcriptase domain-containing protein n=1 Tax=Dibothriocephalus latus TaxID=60516 RepID=A0A3P7LIU1_DIBLA|nr:unnamed protein product [Dibothriocephalus latus]
MHNSPYHAIAKWVADKLKPLQQQLAPRNFQDTFKFTDDLKAINLNGLMMLSLDVSSLFTNVPVTETPDYIYGVAVGSPFGPLLANIFMVKLEKFQLSDQIYKLKHYGCYVDGIFAIAPAETDVDVLLNTVNQAHPSIEFTLEVETTGSLPFLHVLLSRRPNGSV